VTIPYEYAIWLGIIGVAAVFIAMAAKVVPQTESHIIERLGKFNKTLEAGFNFIIPFIDTVVNKTSSKEQIFDIPRIDVITKDNVLVGVDAVCYIRIVDPKRATYGVENLRAAIVALSISSLRGKIGDMSLDETLSGRDAIGGAVTGALDSAAGEWGTKITRVEVSEIAVSREIQQAMELQMTAEREKRAVETRAEGEKNKVQKESDAQLYQAQKEAEAKKAMADADAYAQTTVANAQREAMEAINAAMAQNANASNFLLEKDRIAAFSELARSDAPKWIVPSDMKGTLSGIGIMAAAGLEAFQTTSGSK